MQPAENHRSGKLEGMLTEGAMLKQPEGAEAQVEGVAPWLFSAKSGNLEPARRGAPKKEKKRRMQKRS